MTKILWCQLVGALNEILTLEFRYSSSDHPGWQNDCGKLRREVASNFIGQESFSLKKKEKHSEQYCFSASGVVKNVLGFFI